MKIIAEEKCHLCGNMVKFQINEAATLLREAGCSCCGVSLRTNDLAASLINAIHGRSEDSLKDCIADFADLKILNMFSEGKIHESLMGLSGYHFGEFFDGIKSGEFCNGIQCIDLQNIPFSDGYFDIIITEDVLEHIEDIDKAFREINRVLKLGGMHVFTVPVHEKYPTVSRKGNDKVVYHGDPLREKGAFVFTDFGNDMIEILSRYNMETHEFVHHRFFSINEISYMDEEYDNYLAHQDDLSQAFRYNSIVYVAKKKMQKNLRDVANEDKGIFKRILGWARNFML